MTETPHPAPSPPSPPRTRVFLGWDQGALAAAATRLADLGQAAGEEGGVLELRGFRVVLPGGRARRRILELLLDASEMRGRPLLPPDLVTAGGLPERLFRPDLPPPVPEVAEAAWRRALQEADPASLERLLPHLPSTDGGGDAQWRALATTVASLHARVGAEGHDFRAVARQASQGLLFNDEERWQVLARIQDRYRALLVQAGYRDVEDARIKALARGLDLPPPQPGGAPIPHHLVLVGVVDLPGVVRRFVEGWPGPVTALIHAPEARADDFDSLGVIRPERWEDRPLRIPRENLRVVNRPGDQGRVLLEHLRSLEGAFAPEEITVGVPDESLVPAISGVLEEAGVPARYAGGRPLHRTAPWRLLQGVADLLDGWSYDAFASLLRHPAVAEPLGVEAGGGGLPLSAVADRYQALHLPARLGGRLPQGRESGEARDLPRGAPFHRGSPGPSLLRIRDALEALMARAGVAEARGKDAAPRPLAGWVGPLRALLAALYPGRVLDRNHPGDRELLAFLEAAAPVLEGFEALPPALDSEAVPAWRALRVFLARLREGAVPPPAEEAAVELLGWLELHLDDAPVLVVAGVNEPHLPESVTADPFLPHALRTRLGMADNRRRRARDQYLLEAILASRPGTLLVAGRRDDDGNPLRISRLLLREEGPAVANRLLQLLGAEGEADFEPLPQETGAGFPPAASHPEGASVPGPHLPASHPPEAPFTLPPEPLISAPGGPPDRIAVTTFRAILRDPYLYALERIRGIERVTDEGRELDPMGFGTLAHAVVEGWSRTPDASRQDEATLRRHLDQELDRIFQKRYGDHPLPALRLQREQLRARLHALAGVQALRNAQGWEIRAVEAAPVGEGVPFTVDGLPILLRGRIDRVDFHPGTGRWQLLDLKTSERPTSPDEAHRTRRGVWKDLQLPLYRHLARGLPSAEPEAPASDSAAPSSEPGAPPSEARAPSADPPGAFLPLIPPDAQVETGYIQLPGDPEGVAFVLSTWDAGALEEADEEARRVVRILRENRFTWDPAASTLRAGDALAPVVGRGVMQDEDEGDASGEEGADD
jgi:ATP-dependent helicase/nuclease subunit B